MKTFPLFIFAASVLLYSCGPDEPDDCDGDNNGNLTPYTYDLPTGFPPMPLPNEDVTEEGIALGKDLFYDPILSLDNSQSCGSCHNQAFGFTDNGKALSTGITGDIGTRNSMAIINLGWHNDFFWDGRSHSLEDQALGPVPNPIEMNLSWPEALDRLNNNIDYAERFERVYNASPIDSTHVVRAISEFERTLISGNSRFDKAQRGELILNEQERLGMEIFNSERGDCFHCHGQPFFTDHVFHNNGLSASLDDLGLGAVTGREQDNGRFKSPTLRNIAVTGPYMHDGRFNTLEEVVEFYNSGVQQNSPNIDPLMLKNNRPGGSLGLSPDERAALVAFLHTLTDEEFLTNPDFAEE